MKPTMTRSLSAAALGLALTITGAAHAGEASTTIAGGDIHEACADLQAGQVWHYRFTASAPLDFNIHFHEESRVEYPVRLVDVAAHSDRYTASAARTYCLMWTNLGDATVELRHSATVGD